MKPSEMSNKPNDGVKKEETKKPFFRPAKDDTKPLLQDPILRSDPIETEEAVLRLPPVPDCFKSKSQAPFQEKIFKQARHVCSNSVQYEGQIAALPAKL